LASSVLSKSLFFRACSIYLSISFRLESEIEESESRIKKILEEVIGERDFQKKILADYELLQKENNGVVLYPKHMFALTMFEFVVQPT